eukprot:GHRQ01036739.1.p1 GENE.GHRQ01036739.1~~GHRQ01036739.1.p1  ORF type:complete len:107 (+),score=33.20 GHRQ01036739.1:191-511(+)
MHPSGKELTSRLLLKAWLLLPPVTAWLCSMCSPPRARGVSRPLMPLLISSAGSTTSMASTPEMTRFMVRSAGRCGAAEAVSLTHGMPAQDTTRLAKLPSTLPVRNT